MEVSDLLVVMVDFCEENPGGAAFIQRCEERGYTEEEVDQELKNIGGLE